MAASFAICIPVYNGADFLEEALESIEQQTLKDVLVLVSDNASTDATPDLLDKWSSRLNMRVVRHAETLPMRDHFNAILDMVDCDYYMLLCHDDYLTDPEALALAHAALTENPDVGAVYCDLRYVGENRRKLSDRIFSRTGFFDATATGIKAIRTTRNLFGIPLAIRRSSLGDLRYDPTFYYTMDIDLSWEISRSSPAFHISKVLIANRYGATNATWGLLSKSLHEYIDLAKKHNVRMNALDKLRLAVTNFAIAQQKRVFGVYARLVSWQK